MKSSRLWKAMLVSKHSGNHEQTCFELQCILCKNVHNIHVNHKMSIFLIASVNFLAIAILTLDVMPH